MKTIAIVSTTGGAGRTMLTAALAVLLARGGRPVVALDFDGQNLLGVQLGLDAFAPAGISRALAGADAAWHAYTWRNADGVLFVPYGHVDPAQALACDARLAADSGWLARVLADVALPAAGVTLIDTARFPSQQAAHALRCADLALCVVPPDPAACATAAARLPELRAASAGALRIVVNRLNPARDMQRDVLAMLRAAAGPGVVLEQRVHLDAALPEALARGTWFFDDAPHSQASHDLHGVAGWVDAWLDTQAARDAAGARA
ncbi:cellulose synthase operon protein YhjQ [Burkholderia thailandensis E264]|uniref:Cellulose biosynthesis protein, putative n=1 Tax=Burkholderia thailandensis (strain ATCC 700388 / DSM 13276 / CCUG 48851 / CIP 106301 / E264) TaxID=271848 RepID=Q2T756_BURTA|nr:cellulose biosynthesis protein BcsQ [Burkholderia thailandensis]ABC34378.1 cellulose biosynthesis protein, putative [Burkholderia thailandensis E264]AHI75643.1 cellulose synthase operon protein YhjQ [Burkholderia thailandensis 2002721723]AIP27361.1 cellulose synthase operon protein YhjQ [Burkholderia thailandensis E264]AJY02533.1 cellulose synthase operon protein YhjQ [Burkholderia thailandensis 2002721643]NBC90452.1 cellulose synthase operon protein YhjQ [Burkholderia thailandensis]